MAGSVAYADFSHHVADNATLVSGGDTRIVGANVDAHRVIAQIGGDLKLASVQDTSQSAAHQSSLGGGFNASFGGASASFSMQTGRAKGNYASVNEQSGIQAGAGGFEIGVKGNTDLKGAYIASRAEPDENRLTTGTLSFSDIANHAHYRASSFGVGAGGTVGNGGNSYATHGPASGTNTGGALPVYLSESGSSSGTTRSAVSAGAIVITDEANQKQDVSALERDTSNLNGKVSKTPDLQDVLNKQSDLINATQAAAEAVAKQVGNYADRKQREALAAAENETDPTRQAQYLQDAKAWSEGGANRVALHTAGGALTGGLTGGGLGAVGGAAGAGVAAQLAPQMDEIARSIKDAGPTGNRDVDQLLGNVASNVLAGGAGALVGGGVGALAGASVDRYNRQLRPEERKLAKYIADKSNGRYMQAQVEDQMRLMGVSYADGEVPPDVAEELNGRTPTDPGAQWINAALINENGNPLVIQSLPQANQALQTFIMENYNLATPGQVPSIYTYTPTPVGMDVRGTMANVAGGVSIAAGRFGAVAAAGATIPSPYAPGLATAAYFATVAGIAADAVVQIAKPDVGQYWTNSGITMISDRLSTKYPLAGPVINEATNKLNDSNLSQSIQDFINSSWNRITNQSEKR